MEYEREQKFIVVSVDTLAGGEGSIMSDVDYVDGTGIAYSLFLEVLVALFLQILGSCILFLSIISIIVYKGMPFCLAILKIMWLYVKKKNQCLIYCKIPYISEFLHSYAVTDNFAQF